MKPLRLDRFGAGDQRAREGMARLLAMFERSEVSVERWRRFQEHGDRLAEAFRRLERVVGVPERRPR